MLLFSDRFPIAELAGHGDGSGECQGQTGRRGISGIGMVERKTQDSRRRVHGIGDDVEREGTAVLSLRHRAGRSGRGIVSTRQAGQVSHAGDADVVGSRLETGKEVGIFRSIRAPHVVAGDQPALVVEQGQRRIERSSVPLGGHFQAQPPEMARVELDAIQGDGVRSGLKVERTGDFHRGRPGIREIDRVARVTPGTATSNWPTTRLVKPSVR